MHFLLLFRSLVTLPFLLGTVIQLLAALLSVCFSSPLHVMSNFQVRRRNE